MSVDRVVVAGASGFIGRALLPEFAAAGFEIVALTRDVARHRAGLPDEVIAAEWDGRTVADWARYVDGAFAVVNLTGDNLAQGRWTKAKKRRILNSRTGPGAGLVEAIRRARTKPRVFVQGSAIGAYGSPGEVEADETSPPGEGFLADVVRQWEASTRDVETLGVRRVVVRSGLVLGRGGGVWPSLARPVRVFVGGPLASGRQWFSWIHIEDEARAIRFLIGRDDLSGVFNLTAPRPLREGELCRTIAKAVRRPCWLPVPALLLRLLFGEKADETLLVSQRVVPKRLEAAGFAFRYPDAAAAVAALVRRGPRAGSAAG